MPVPPRPRTANLQRPDNTFSEYAFVCSQIVACMVALYIIAFTLPLEENIPALLAVLISAGLAGVFAGLYVVPLVLACRYCFERQQNPVPAMVLVLLGSWLGLRVVRSALSQHSVVRKAPDFSIRKILTVMLFGLSISVLAGFTYFNERQEKLKQEAAAARALEQRLERDAISDSGFIALRERKQKEVERREKLPDNIRKFILDENAVNKIINHLPRDSRSDDEERR